LRNMPTHLNHIHETLRRMLNGIETHKLRARSEARKKEKFLHNCSTEPFAPLLFEINFESNSNEAQWKSEGVSEAFQNRDMNADRVEDARRLTLCVAVYETRIRTRYHNNTGLHNLTDLITVVHVK
jgi:hypothetical protein